MKIDFFKFHGTGNDFVVLDNRGKNYNVLKEKDIALICHRRFGIGADGLIMLENLDNGSFFMRFYNCDGKETTMCGNGGRCIAAFAHYLKLTQNDIFKFFAIDGAHEAKIAVSNDMLWQVDLKMQDVDKIENRTEGIFLNTGSPHLVRFTEDIEELDIVKEGSLFRYSNSFKPSGTNVNFVKVLNNQTLRVRTYERGVEDETYSCGTGSVAAAIATYVQQLVEKLPISIITKGGSLQVSFSRKSDSRFIEVWLSGPAQLVFKGEYYL